MPPLVRRWAIFVILSAFLVLALIRFVDVNQWRDYIHEHQWHQQQPQEPEQEFHPTGPLRDAFRKWRNINMRFPIDQFKQVPLGKPSTLPGIQHDFSRQYEPAPQREERLRRRDAVKEAFVHSWEGYQKNAWLHDEIMPISGRPKDPFGSWGATLIDTLDTLWIMQLSKEFDSALGALKQIDFTVCAMDNINLFETTIRYLGGLLGAYEVSERKHPALLQKAIELGEMLYHAFDTNNHLPITRWDWRVAEANDREQMLPERALVAEVGSLTLEFTKLSQLTYDPKYFDAVQRISELFAEQQNKTNIPGLWPTTVNTQAADLSTGDSFTLGGMADSLYEYLPKQYLLLQGQEPIFKDMYLNAMQAIKEYLVFEPMVPPRTTPIEIIESTSEKPQYLHATEEDVRPLVLGSALSTGPHEVVLQTEGQHLTCFAGGMMALGARAIVQPQSRAQAEEDIRLGKELAAGCVWSYRNTATGIGPELYHAHSCRKGRDATTNGLHPDWEGERGNCEWDREVYMNAMKREQNENAPGSWINSKDPKKWDRFLQDRHLSEGFTAVTDPRYMLRPEAIESLFVLYRITGDHKYQDQAWDMFQAITRLTKTPIAYASLADVTVPPSIGRDGAIKANLIDSMESFWTAETLKYLYLIFDEPEAVSLDEFVLNTEAHPFRWRKWNGRQE